MGCSKAKFKFFNIDENILISTSKEDYKNDKKNSIDVIANNTENTWQQDRSKTELIKNTTQGKIVEDMFCELIDYHNKASKDGKKLTYVSYDEIRTDKFKKHAPIDGLLYVEGNSNINNAIAMINKDVEKNTYGKLSYDTKNNLSDFKIRTVEIKSSNIPQKDYNNINKDNFSKVSEQKKLISNLRKRDFFVYPKYTRTKGETIHCFKDYCNYVKQNFQEYHNLDDKQVEDKICDIEKKDKCDIYTRIFIDKSHTKSFIGYVLGYALGTDFFDNPKIINMYQAGKSENAMYYVYPISKCNSILELFNDDRLW